MAVRIKRMERPLPYYRIVQESIKTYILENKLPAGAPLPPETELARQLGVSRSSVREAAKALESVGILESRPGTGLFVQEFSFDPILDNLSYGLLFDLGQLADLLEVRRVIEIGMIELAIQTLPAGQLIILQNLVETMRLQAERGKEFSGEDREFHIKIFEHLDNKMMLKLLDIFWMAFHRAFRQADLKNTDIELTFQNHKAILLAIMANDVSQARRALEQHYTGIQTGLE